jgi:DMSO/TMAO reductase YedYZ molybdopterin-dependent catalytic subunit
VNQAKVTERGTPVGRRIFLGLVALGGVSVIWGSKIQRGLTSALAPVTSHDPTGLSSLLPTAGFTIYSVTNSIPSRKKSDYQLKVGGLVSKPMTLTFDELLALPETKMTKDFQCVTGWRVYNVKWRGVLLRDLLDHVGADPKATALRFHSFDGEYTESLTMEQARRADVLIAYDMDGSGTGIGAEHGGPVRLYVAPMYGYKSIKWLDTIEVVDKVTPGYWEDLGYDVDGWIGRSNGRDDNPV